MLFPILVTTAFTVALQGGATTQAQTQTPPPAQTQVSPPSPGAADAGADMTTATFGDWLMRCRQTEAGKPARTCEVVQTVMVQGQTAPFAQLAFGRLAPADPLFFTVVVPPNVTFPSTLRVAFDEKDKQPVEVAWTRCLPGGCFASLAVPADTLARWRAREEAGRMSFKNGAGQETTVAMSFRGLARALDALAKEGGR